MTKIEELELRITKALDRLGEKLSAGARSQEAPLDFSLELIEARNVATLAQNKLDVVQTNHAREGEVLRAKINTLTDQVSAFEVERADSEKVNAALTTQISEKEQEIAQLREDLSEQVRRRDEDLAALDAMIAELEEAGILQRGRMKSYAG